jgi:hypothetical protein
MSSDKKKQDKIIKKINSKIEINFDKEKGTFSLSVVGKKDKDKLYLRMNEQGSGTHNIEKKPIFSDIRELNGKLGTFGKIKMQDFKPDE